MRSECLGFRRLPLSNFHLVWYPAILLEGLEGHVLSEDVFQRSSWCTHRSFLRVLKMLLGLVGTLQRQGMIFQVCWSARCVFVV